MKRLALALTVAAGALFAMNGSTPPHIAEMQSISRLGPWPEEPALVQQGKASFYANSLDGKQTASGAAMDQDAFTAASKTLPLGTHARVTNLATGESVTVEVNDRGPFVRGRVIDLSKRAADAISLREDGVAPVKIEAKPEDQPTPELKRKVAKIAAARETAAKHRAAHQTVRKKAHPKSSAEQTASAQEARRR